MGRVPRYGERVEPRGGERGGNRDVTEGLGEGAVGPASGECDLRSRVLDKSSQ